MHIKYVTTLSKIVDLAESLNEEVSSDEREVSSS
jgi:hypothetical protein